MNNCFLATAISLILLSLPLNARKGDGVGNGGGIAENNFIYAYYNVEDFVLHSFDDPRVQFTDPEKLVLEKILANLDSEYETKKPIKFLSRKKNGEMHRRRFCKGFPKCRTAVTGSKVASPIYVNLDHIYYSSNGKRLALPLTRALSMIVHELGHHHKIKDEDFLDTMGSKVSSSMKGKALSYPMSPKHRYINARVFKINNRTDQFDHFLISDKETVYDITHVVRNNVKCPVISNKIYQLVSTEVWQTHWTSFGSSTPYIKSELILFCRNQDGIKMFAGNELITQPSFIEVNKVIKIKEVKYRYKACDFSSSQCLAKQQEAEKYINQNNQEL